MTNGNEYNGQFKMNQANGYGIFFYLFNNSKQTKVYIIMQKGDFIQAIL